MYKQVKGQKYLYMIMSSTPNKLGAFIRSMTGFHYNHVSLCLGINSESETFPFYSFARYYQNAPFYGGFVKESIQRYKNFGKYSDFVIFALPVSDKKYAAIKRYLETLESRPGEYLYNMLSAACNPFHKKVIIKDCYTCLEFAVEILTKFRVTDKLDTQKFYSIKDIYDMFEDHMVYEGSSEPFFKDDSASEDSFFVEKSQKDLTKLTVSANASLVGKFFKGLFK